MAFSFAPTAEDKASNSFDPIPAGWYVCRIESAREESKVPEKASIALQLKVHAPNHVGRVIFARFNIKNPNIETVRIARQQLAGLCNAIGKPNGFNSVQELVGAMVDCKVSVRPEANGYEASNDVKGYREAKGYAAHTPSAAATTPTTTKVAASDFSDDDIF